MKVVGTDVVHRVNPVLDTMHTYLLFLSPTILYIMLAKSSDLEKIFHNCIQNVDFHHFLRPTCLTRSILVHYRPLLKRLLFFMFIISVQLLCSTCLPTTQPKRPILLSILMHLIFCLIREIFSSRL